MALEAVEQGCTVMRALLDKLRRQGWITTGKVRLRLTDVGREALQDDLSARMGHRSGSR
jgi:hypothetical protein